ncbi:MAG: Recombination protein RecR [Candidatus Gottesmanbacteria bacterium GW2011_GWB1_43_11]|uniref:Recombination protein RecR n=1 Tax=Candidatus Gottesmanbacteria bacterium GW2011_GWB1_43_11 TaxID=1618446 RepID=A0A0G1FIE6_9BACT|nr:MAG: Recombination protein RecR [Candidatus Gottesmanbacteria bacterium GW2011_GWA2_42_16]KKS55359.1 MAG: Recombination protein RecR [Candidatus Gottesmanbacteria bacterium GW2011_GWA1_42_26]KKS82088.1 MAG: recombination protein RecR, recombination protein RecR [Candidatus Gottesmanbacteria bacterium GW2011_GWC1_43_10]KKS86603.1 MAG: Recombination protein RecR [Candidatus Gottesmanbacteria bacterium GW2011_GWB1_43_11]OGG09194.1 MAG: recombination protein RecR [Candidatus Gottesmanbacteria ba
MFFLPKPVSKLIDAFERLPGIGPKTAQRLTFYLLHVPQEYLENFAEALNNLKRQTMTCSVCFNVSEADPCLICASPSRNKALICVVEQPLDILSLERTGKFAGVYHVLNGAINPLNNIGPDEIRIHELVKRVQDPASEIREIILATNPNMEGEATAMYIVKQIQNAKIKNQNESGNIRITRLAHGLPMGADIEYADEITLTRALEGRREF